MAPAAHSPLPLLPLRGSRGAGSASPAGTVDLPSAVPAPGEVGEEGDLQPGDPVVSRRATLSALQAAIQSIERPSLEAGRRSARSDTPFWTFGCSATDTLLPQGLERDCVHEVKPAARGQGACAGDWTAGLGFALRLAALRLEQCRRAGRPQFLLWCWPRAAAQELGQLSARGLRHLGIDPARVLVVESAREAQALMALEEGLKSGALALAAGVFQEVGLNAARRLSLAAAARHTPALLMTHPSRTPAGGCATRWRVAGLPSAPHPFDAKAPGAARFAVALERCRARPQSTGLPPRVLEWCDETLRFRMAAELAHDVPAARRAGRGAR